MSDKARNRALEGDTVIAVITGTHDRSGSGQGEQRKPASLSDLSDAEEDENDGSDVIPVGKVIAIVSRRENKRIAGFVRPKGWFPSQTVSTSAALVPQHAPRSRSRSPSPAGSNRHRSRSPAMSKKTGAAGAETPDAEAAKGFNTILFQPQDNRIPFLHLDAQALGPLQNKVSLLPSKQDTLYLVSFFFPT